MPNLARVGARRVSLLRLLRLLRLGRTTQSLSALLDRVVTFGYFIPTMAA